jgi:hypothetical protein
MAELLESFLELAHKDEKNLSVATLLTEDERIEWEALVKALDSIDVMNVGESLEKVSKMFTLVRWQEMSILAYVKILEMMIHRAKEVGALDGGKIPTPPQSPQTDNPYTGSMFG